LRVLYDTNILLQILRQSDSVERLQAHLGSNYLQEYISIVTVAEIRSLAIQFSWGQKNIQRMGEFLSAIPILDINSPDILDRYVEIDCYSKRKHPNLSSDFAAIKMGKNDLWIAATASVYECGLLTMDKDFQHLNIKFVNVVYIRKEIFI
jgi:tRNA(fMet)-specific endonuclease VapC